MVDSQHTVVFKMTEQFIKEISNYGIVPVIKIDRVEDAIPLAQALRDGGLPVAEVTYRTDCAEAAIKAIHQEFPDMILAAGTVLTCEQVDSAVAAGAQFIVSPGLNPKIVEYCNSISVPIIPGVSSASDIEQALELGLSIVKFFPAEANGGLNAIKAMSAPYGNLRFMPTGGVNEQNLNDYLAFDKILACGGTWMVKKDLIDAKDFDSITRLTRQAVSKMLSLEVSHIGINNDGAYEQNVKLLSKLLMTVGLETSKSTFIKDIELMDDVYNGDHGHIGISCSDVERAVFHLQQEGFKFDFDSAKTKNGHLDFIYLEGQITGFAIHLFRK